MRAPGGSWLTSSLYANGWPTIQELVFGNGNAKAGWLLDSDQFFPAGKEITATENVLFYADIVESVLGKAATGMYVVSLTSDQRKLIRTRAPVIRV